MGQHAAVIEFLRDRADGALEVAARFHEVANDNARQAEQARKEGDKLIAEAEQLRKSATALADQDAAQDAKQKA